MRRPTLAQIRAAAAEALALADAAAWERADKDCRFLDDAVDRADDEAERCARPPVVLGQERASWSHVIGNDGKPSSARAVRT